MIELFSVMDQAARRFMDPFPAPTIEFAIRGFREACSTDGHQFGKFPEDYTLWHVGSFDPDLGVIVTITAAKLAIASAYTNNLELEA